MPLRRQRPEAAVLEANPQLEVISNVAVGVDNIDLPVARRLGITVTNTPDVLTETTADLAVALMLAVARRLPEADTYVRSGSWTAWTLAPALMGVDLYGKTLGLFGMGRIGRAVARRAVHGFGMRRLYASRSPLPAVQEAELGASRVDLDDLLAAADVVSLHAALTPETHHVLGAAQLASMKSSAILVNTARGPLVDERALAEALENGQLWGAALDVFEDEPTVHPRLLAVRGAPRPRPARGQRDPGHPPAHGRHRRSGRAGSPGGAGSRASGAGLTGAVTTPSPWGAGRRGCGISP